MCLDRTNDLMSRYGVHQARGFPSSAARVEPDWLKRARSAARVSQVPYQPGFIQQVSPRKRHAAVRNRAFSPPRVLSPVVALTGWTDPEFECAPNMRHKASIAASNSLTCAGRDSGRRR
jgi:hypothetical protein